MSHENIELAFVAIAALALVTQAIILLAIYLGISKAAKTFIEDFEDIRTSVLPVVSSTRELVRTTRETITRLTPKVEATVTDATEITRSLRAQAVDVETSLEQVLERIRRQTARIDSMCSNTLDAVDRAGAYVTEAVSKPVRQLNGLLASLKAIVESLRASDPSNREPSVHDDRDTFV
jgi:methyl-accepting chemotaxis protein